MRLAIMLLAVLLLLPGCALAVRPNPANTQKIEIPAPPYQVGKVSWYGGKFHGRRTANSEVFNQNALTAAHKTLPFGTVVEVRDTKTNKTIRVRINDRGPYVKGRILDLSKAAATALGIKDKGVANIELTIVRK